MIPRQEVAGERQQQGEGEQHYADDPVELSGGFVGAVIEDSCHVEKYGQHHQMGGPAVHVAHQQTEGDGAFQGGDVVPCGHGVGAVEEHQEDAGDGQQDEQEEAETAEAEGVAHSHGVAFHLHGVEVIEDAVHDHIRAVAGAVGVASAEDGAGAEDGVPRL